MSRKVGQRAVVSLDFSSFAFNEFFYCGITWIHRRIWAVVTWWLFTKWNLPRKCSNTETQPFWTTAQFWFQKLEPGFAWFVSRLCVNRIIQLESRPSSVFSTCVFKVHHGAPENSPFIFSCSFTSFETISCNLDWPQTHFVAEDGFESCLHLPPSRNTDLPLQLQALGLCSWASANFMAWSFLI